MMNAQPLSTLAMAALLVTYVRAAGAYCDPSSLPSLGKTLNGRVKVGAAVGPEQLRSVPALLSSQFNSLVAENAMKPSRLQPQEGRFDFAAADAIVTFAADHKMAVRGHTLLWYKGTPDWFWTTPSGRPASRDLVLSRLKTHIDTVVGRYRGSVYAWDVVNEVVDPAQSDCLRHDQWWSVVGPDYIEAAFRFAHAADPRARLFLNDYSTTEARKRGCLVRVVRGLQARGVPLHGIGHQMHVSLYYPRPADVDRSLRLFANLGLENQITEIDMSLYRNGRSALSDSGAHLLKKQGARYRTLMRVFLAHPDVNAVTWWGVTDAHSWRTSAGKIDQPLLFNADGCPKPAFWSVMDAAGVRQ
jgi:endo-1,4-beta-xylanase